MVDSLYVQDITQLKNHQVYNIFTMKIIIYFLHIRTIFLSSEFTFTRHEYTTYQIFSLFVCSHSHHTFLRAISSHLIYSNIYNSLSFSLSPHAQYSQKYSIYLYTPMCTYIFIYLIRSSFTIYTIGRK